MIITRTPYRVSLFGGGSDYPAHFERHGGEVFGFAVNRYCWIHLRRLPPFFAYKHRIVYSKTELVRNFPEVQHPAVRETMLLCDPGCGIEMHHDGDLPARSGLGSSSSFVVGLINALLALKGARIVNQRLVETAIHIERDRLGENVGSQDQVWAAHGGFNRILFHPDHSYDVQPVVIARARQQELQDHLMLFFTGFSRNATDIAGDVIKNLGDNVQAVKDSACLARMAGALVSDDGPVDRMGPMLDDAWRAKKSLSRGVSTPEIDDIYAAAVSAGALGGKLLGAGGGGFMLFFVPPERQDAVRNRLDKLVEVQFRIGAPGSTVVLYEPEGL